MAGSFNAQVSTLDTPALIVESESGTTYDEIQQSMGSNAYEIGQVDDLYLASSTAQLVQPVTFIQYDVNGNQQKYVLPPIVDPFQTQSTLYASVAKKNLSFEGRLRVEVDILEATSLSMRLNTRKASPADALKADAAHPSDWEGGRGIAEIGDQKSGKVQREMTPKANTEMRKRGLLEEIIEVKDLAYKPMKPNRSNREVSLKKKSK